MANEKVFICNRAGVSLPLELQPLTTPLKVNADKFHDLTNATGSNGKMTTKGAAKAQGGVADELGLL